MSLMDTIKEHWGKGSALIAVVFQAALAFQRNLSDLSLAARFFICGLAGAWAALSVAEMLRKKQPVVPTGFGQRPTDPPPPLLWYILRVLSMAIVCLLSVFLLLQVATFHSVRILEKHSGTDPFTGTIEIQPAHRPDSLILNLSTSQVEPVSIVDIAPASWNDNDPVKWGVRNQTDFGLTLTLESFKSPQVFGIQYRLSVARGKLAVEASSDPPEIPIIRGRELLKYEKNIWLFGGILCTGVLLYWAYRSSWFHRTS